MNPNTLNSLAAEIRAVCPFVNLELLDPVAFTTRITFAPEADKAQQAAANAVVAGFDPSDEAQAARVAAIAKAEAAKAIDKGQTVGGTPADLANTSVMLAALDQVNELRVIAKLAPITADEFAALVKQKIAQATKP